ncbi:hypothetical protein XENOCAPTIV_014472 [Xenoophorus captivus]|uniref:Uncharacterized protein n=1 Tax=Xenoophorus captivus TaxID=1517983 RepID=A0ABV0RKP6_9TELE
MTTRSQFQPQSLGKVQVTQNSRLFHQIYFLPHSEDSHWTKTWNKSDITNTFLQKLVRKVVKGVDGNTEGTAEISGCLLHVTRVSCDLYMSGLNNKAAKKKDLAKSPKPSEGMCYGLMTP